MKLKVPSDTVDSLYIYDIDVLYILHLLEYNFNSHQLGSRVEEVMVRLRLDIFYLFRNCLVGDCRVKLKLRLGSSKDVEE